MANPHWDGSQFIPGIWKGKVLEKIHKKLRVLNPDLITDYQGEIRELGDQVLFKGEIDKVPFTLLTIDRGDSVEITTYDAIEAQYNEINRVTKNIAEEFIRGMEIPRGRAFFAATVPVVEIQRRPNAWISDTIRTFLIYGYKSINIFRQATEIIAECERRKMDMDETLRELDRAGF